MTDTLLKLYHGLPAPLRSVAASLRGFYLRSWRYGTETDRLIEERLIENTGLPVNGKYGVKSVLPTCCIVLLPVSHFIETFGLLGARTGRRLLGNIWKIGQYSQKIVSDRILMLSSLMTVIYEKCFTSTLVELLVSH